MLSPIEFAAFPSNIRFCNRQIMRRLPHSYLWLLETSSPFRTNPNHPNETLKSFYEGIDIVKGNLERMAELNGVSKDRLIYAPRVKKSEHIARQFGADLFLDTMIYSAHSTATDSLRGVSFFILL